jgi:pyruvate/2-oxoglutarate dehydrogenase complex dihydrolipoamide acyltransferase (E2) component
MHIRNEKTYEHLTGGTVGVSEILIEIDHEIAQLQQARALLAGGVPAAAPKRATAKAAATKPAKKGKKKRHLTPEGRKRIAEAVKRRWAEQKKAATAGK